MKPQRTKGNNGIITTVHSLYQHSWGIYSPPPMTYGPHFPDPHPGQILAAGCCWRDSWIAPNDDVTQTMVGCTFSSPRWRIWWRRHFWGARLCFASSKCGLNPCWMLNPPHLVETSILTPRTRLSCCCSCCYCCCVTEKSPLANTLSTG